ncbi:glycosyltransferase family 39 protein [Sideroxydans sp. CL21]|uniref:glycosyltransferase family 39 protein n=1 Tax=Sideroxydans sp. CL21 TaxID=2600596 RepID=UPI0024BCB029|nr:glycosyltransferase family 39 protein [Sideroxydans sp. CL21]
MIFESAKEKGKGRMFVFVYLLSLLCIGIGYLSILPLFEGFDETAHYSSLRQISDTGTIPLYGTSYLAQEVIDYQGPVPYGSGKPPFDHGMVYSKFFKQPELVEQYQQTYRQHLPSIMYRPSNELNWQAQHPPLYYLLLVPLIKALDEFSFSTQFFLLRLASFFLALSGVALGLLAVNQSNEPPERNPAMIGFLLYPIILPMFFSEFTRIGNDSLCIFFVGLVAYLFSLWLKDERNTKISVAIGIVLGMGLLTKAFFLPITVALAMFLLTRLLLGKRDEVMRSERIWSLFQIFLPAMFIGSGWYLYKLMIFGELTGSSEAIQLAHQGGLIAGLKANFSLYALIRGVTATLVSYSWAGTWSLARLPALLHLPLLALAIWVVFAYFRQLKLHRLTGPAWLPVWIFCFFAFGLIWHVIVGVALNGNGATPGWYLHILMPWAAPAIGMGISSIFQHRHARVLLIVLLVYAVLYQIMALWSQLALFTGCATKGDDKSYVFSGSAFCIDQTSLLMDRMAVLGYPGLAVIGFSGGVICFLWLLVKLWNARHSISSVNVMHVGQK